MAQRPLSQRQRKFAREYIKDLNATQAALRAGYSKISAGESGSELLKDSRIAALIRESTESAAQREEIEVADVLRELRNIGFSDIKDVFNPDGSMKKLDEMPEGARRAISGIEVNEHFMGDTPVGRNSKLKFWNKTEALTLIGKHLKMFADKIEIDAHTTINVVDPYADTP